MMSGSVVAVGSAAPVTGERPIVRSGRLPFRLFAEPHVLLLEARAGRNPDVGRRLFLLVAPSIRELFSRTGFS